MGTRIRLVRLGGHEKDTDIEPSCGVFDVLDGASVRYRIVVDCGLIPRHPDGPDDPLWTVPDLSYFGDGKQIDAILVTHVHGDHVGYLPALSQFMSEEARVFLTRPSAAMIRPILREAISIHERNGTRPPFNAFELSDILRRLHVIHEVGEVEILPGIRCYVHPAGHINGACSFTMRIAGKNVHYAGDRCTHDQPGILGATPLPDAWRPAIIASSDCTYGADPESDNRSWQAEMDKGFEACREAMHRNAPALLFTFGIHRGGALADELARRRFTDHGRIFLDGACRLFSKIVMGEWGSWCDRDQRLHLEGARMVETKDRETIEHRLRKYAMICTPGMGGPGGIGTMWRRVVLPNPDAVVVFTGYLAPGTDGEKMLRAARERDATGIATSLTFKTQTMDGRTELETIPLRSRVMQIRTGSHSPRGETIQWFRDLAPEVAVLSHGSRLALASLEAELGRDIPRIVRADTEHVVEIDL